MNEPVIITTPNQLKKFIADAVTEAIQNFPTAKTEEKPKESWLSRDEVCKLLHISKPTLKQRVLTGVLPAYRTGRRVLFRESDIISHLKKVNTGK